MKKYKIFDIEYLQNSEFTEEDLLYLLETPSLNYSLVVSMFNKYDNSDITNDKIINIITSDKDWPYKHYWNKKQREEFLGILKNCFKNLYRYSINECEALANMWIVQYGFTSAKQKKKKILRLSD